MDLSAFYASLSASGMTLLGLWTVVVDKHPEWFDDALSARMAYVISLQFMIPATTSLLSLVALDTPALWRTLFALLGVTGVTGCALVARTFRGQGVIGKGALLVAIPVYALVGLVGVFPQIGEPVGAPGLALEAFLAAAILLITLNAVFVFTHTPSLAPAETQGGPSEPVDGEARSGPATGPTPSGSEDRVTRL